MHAPRSLALALVALASSVAVSGNALPRQHARALGTPPAGLGVRAPGQELVAAAVEQVNDAPEEDLAPVELSHEPREPEVEARNLEKRASAARTAWLNAHNTVRAKHQVPALTYSAELAKYASQNARKCKFAHSGGPYGENLYASTQTSTSVRPNAVKAWADEVSLYDFSKPGYNSKTGHFTQVVWKNTKEVGCAVVDCPNESLGFGGYKGTGQVVFCEYRPPGNYVGATQFKANVLPAK